jgi:hypothetical protein
MSYPGEPPLNFPDERTDPFGEDAAVNPTGPYKPRKIKNDPYHRALRDAHKKKPPNAVKDAQHKRTRDKWEHKNKIALDKRQDFVHDKRKHMGLSSALETPPGITMATSKPLFQKTDSVTALSATPSKVIQNIGRELLDIEQELLAVDLLSQKHRRLMATASTLFSIGDGKPAPTNSPGVALTNKQKVDEKSLKILREKSEALTHLHSVMDRISALASQLMQGSPADSKETAVHMKHIQALKSSTETKLNSEYDFLQGLATKSAPPEFSKLCDKIATVARNSLSYENVTAYLYAFETEGYLCFARYLHLETLTSDDGRLIPDLYIVATLRGTDHKTFLEVNHDWVQPGPVLFLKEVTAEPKSLVRAMSQLLAISHFASSIGDIPLKLLLSVNEMKSKIRAPEAVSHVSVDEDTGALTFYLKPTIQDPQEIKDIAFGLHADVQNMTRRNGGSLRHTVQMDPDPKRGAKRKNWRVVFTASLGSGKMAATSEDLGFLHAKYGMNPQQVDQVVKLINKAAGG